MKLVIQRVNHASVKIDGQVNGEIENGFMILVGSEKNDNQWKKPYTLLPYPMLWQITVS